MRRTLRYTAAAAMLLLAACGEDPYVIIDGDEPGAPRDLLATYEWVLEGFNGTQPVGHPTVELTWLPPTDWSGEVFRVYGKRSSASSFSRIGTVTSCTVDGCVYRDRNVSAGETYDYYVAAYNERSGGETSSDYREVIQLPSSSRPAAPGAGRGVGLDDAVYLRWTDTQNGARLAKYIVYLTELDGQSYLYPMGETDGTGFLDQRARNGHEYVYRIAAVDTMGHVSNLGPELVGIARPDVTGELIYAHADDPARSGFRFMTDETMNPIVSGTSTTAHWRLESDANGWYIRPLNGTQVVRYSGRTTALTCGPGADANCRAATVAPATGYTTAAIPVDAEYSYVFRVIGADGQPHYAVVRAVILGTDQNGRDLLIFDWAYQLIPNEPKLNRIGG